MVRRGQFIWSKTRRRVSCLTFFWFSLLEPLSTVFLLLLLLHSLLEVLSDVLLHSPLEVLSDVLLVLVSLLVPELHRLDLQLYDGTFDLIVLTDE